MLTQLAIYQAGQPARASGAVVNVKPRCLPRLCRQMLFPNVLHHHVGTQTNGCYILFPKVRILTSDYNLAYVVGFYQTYQHGTMWEPLVDVRSAVQKSLTKLSYQPDRNSWCLQ